MDFKQGKFYRHNKGRYIAILSEVKTYKWGKQFIIEEVDETGHAISCMDIDSEDTAGNWIEIGCDEFLANFKPDNKKVLNDLAV